MRRTRWVPRVFGVLAVLGALLLVACAPAVAPPAPTPTAKPAAAAPTPTAAAAPTVKPAAPTTAPATPTPQPVKLKVGGLGTLADVGNFVAYKKGYFKEQGIDVEFVTFDSGAKMIAPLGTGELDVGRGAISVGLFNAILRGIDIKAVGDANTTSPALVAKDYAAAVVRKDLAGEIKSEKDLRGRKIAIPALGIGVEQEIDRLLATGGLTRKDIDFQGLGMPDGVAALAGKSLDVFVGLGEPFLTQALERGAAVYWKSFSEIYPNHTVSVLMYPGKFTKEKPEVARRFAVAYVKGLRDYYDAFFKNKNRGDIVAILTEMTTVKDPAIYDKVAPLYVNPDGYVNTDSVTSDINYFTQNKQIESGLDISKVVDNSFMEYAVQRLGKYQ